MTLSTFSTSLEAQQAAVLLESYRFELGGHDARQWVSLWLEFYRPSWIRDAVVEALYQGRYKSVSVRQILELWHRRGQPIRHVTHDFEAAICREFGEVKAAPPAAIAPHRSIRLKEPRSPLSSEAPATDSRSNSIVSFNLSDFPLASPGMASALDVQMSGQMNGPVNGPINGPINGQMNGQMNGQLNGQINSQSSAQSTQPNTSLNDTEQPSAPSAADSTRPTKSSRKVLDNKAWREFSSYTTPTYADIDSEEVLNAQRQFKGVLYSSAKAIQPFKPALPFSAQTLRLAKQKALSSMADAR